MQYSIDEIYDLFMWDTQRSDEENEAKMQKGIDSAKQIKNIFPFMQPILASPEKSKSVWEPCAKVIAMRSDEELQPYMYLLLEWIQDLNWPGALMIYNRLTQIPFSSMKLAFRHTRTMAEQTNDSCWLAVLDGLYQDMEKNKKA